MKQEQILIKVGQTILALFVGVMLSSAGCEKKTTPAPITPTTPTTPATPTVTERMNKTWKVTLVKEDAAVVYTKGVTTSLRMGYADFILNLSSLSASKLTAVDGNTFNGTWSISADGKTLTLLGLTPEPTGTGGTIAYSIDNLTDTVLKMTRNSVNKKTGAAKTEYEMTNQ
jgi:hypothetical protein